MRYGSYEVMSFDERLPTSESQRSNQSSLQINQAHKVKKLCHQQSITNIVAEKMSLDTIHYIQIKEIERQET